MWLYAWKPEMGSKSSKNMFWVWAFSPENCVNPLYRSKFKVLTNLCCGYSKLVSRDAWHNGKGINSIQTLHPEKSPKCGRILLCWNIPEILNILDVSQNRGLTQFSGENAHTQTAFFSDFDPTSGFHTYSHIEFYLKLRHKFQTWTFTTA